MVLNDQAYYFLNGPGRWNRTILICSTNRCNTNIRFRFKNGADNRDRTDDLDIGNVTLLPLSYIRIKTYLGKFKLSLDRMPSISLRQRSSNSLEIISMPFFRRASISADLRLASRALCFSHHNTRLG